MSPLERARFIFAPSFPRVSGDEPLEVLDGYVLLTFSPRERG